MGSIDDSEKAPERRRLTFPVVAASAEYLVMGHLMRRNVLTYKAPPNNEGYDLDLHPPRPSEKANGTGSRAGKEPVRHGL